MANVSKVVISGLTAAGKTTHAKLLCQEYGLKYVSASQILLKVAGLDPEQPPDFWVTPEGRQISRRISWVQIDDEFRRLESESDDTVFDCQSLPWLCSRECFNIWIDSSRDSRVMKALVSHKGESNLTLQDVGEGVDAKDQFAREQILTNYGIDLFQDRQPIDFIVDISSFITAPTEEASRLSILNAHKIISSAVGWYLFEDKSCRDRFEEELATYGDSVLIRYPSIHKSGID